MSISKLFFIAISLLINTSCTNEDTFISYTGNMPSQKQISNLSVGQSKQEVTDLLGSPAATVALDKDTWMYLSSTVEQVAFMRPQEIKRDLLVVRFDNNDKVYNIEELDENDGKKLIANPNKTAPNIQEQGFFLKYFGGVQEFSPLGNSIDPSRR